MSGLFFCCFYFILLQLQIIKLDATINIIVAPSNKLIRGIEINALNIFCKSINYYTKIFSLYKKDK
jgi:hypothetical protein